MVKPFKRQSFWIQVPTGYKFLLTARLVRLINMLH